MYAKHIQTHFSKTATRQNACKHKSLTADETIERMFADDDSEVT